MISWMDFITTSIFLCSGVMPALIDYLVGDVHLGVDGLVECQKHSSVPAFPYPLKYRRDRNADRDELHESVVAVPLHPQALEVLEQGLVEAQILLPGACSTARRRTLGPSCTLMPWACRAPGRNGERVANERQAWWLRTWPNGRRSPSTRRGRASGGYRWWAQPAGRRPPLGPPWARTCPRASSNLPTPSVWLPLAWDWHECVDQNGSHCGFLPINLRQIESFFLTQTSTSSWLGSYLSL